MPNAQNVEDSLFAGVDDAIVARTIRSHSFEFSPQSISLLRMLRQFPDDPPDTGPPRRWDAVNLLFYLRMIANLRHSKRRRSPEGIGLLSRLRVFG